MRFAAVLAGIGLLFVVVLARSRVADAPEAGAKPIAGPTTEAADLDPFPPFAPPAVSRDAALARSLEPTPVAGTPPITGVVIDRDGSPIRDATISATSGGAMEETRSADDGTFSVVPPPAPRVAILVSTPAHVGAIRGDVRPGDRIIFVLGRGRRVSGRVVDRETGEPIAGATLRVRSAAPSGPDAPPVESREDGRFDVVLPDPTLNLSVQSDGYHGVTFHGLSPDTLRDEWTVSLAPQRVDRAVYYRVTNALTGRAVPGVEIDPGPALPLGDGLHRAGSRPGFSADRARIRAPGHVERRVDFVRPRGETPDGAVEVPMHPETVATGRVIDGEGRPVTGASVMLDRIEEPSFDPHPFVRGNARSDSDGRFRIDGLLRDAKYELWCSHDAFARLERVERTSPDTASWDLGAIVLDGSRAVTGLVIRAEDDEPIADAIVSSGTRVARSGSDGRFVLRHVTASSGLRVEAPGRAPAMIDAQGDGDTTIRLSAGASIRGAVVDEDGGPLAGAWIRTETHGLDDDLPEPVVRVRRGFTVTTSSDLRGRFELDGLPPGRHRLYAGRGDRNAPSRPPIVEAGETDVVIVLPRPSGVIGRVVSAPGGEPITHFKVEQRTSAMHMAETRESGTGSFWISAPPDEPLTLAVWADGYSRHESSDIVLTPGEIRKLVFPLTAAASVEGLVLDPHGAPLPDVEIRVVPVLATPSFVRRRSVSDTHGRYLVDDLSAGEHRFVANSRGASEVPLTVTPPSVTLADGQRARIDLRARPPAGPELVGTLRLPDDPTRSHVVIDLASETVTGRDGRFRAHADADGRFRIAAIPPGRYRVRVDYVLASTTSASIQVEPTVLEIPDTDRFDCELSGEN
ncbi:MAG: hypothetical protein ACF8XB_17375 [Planctomycetota bacterium JB042]